MHSHWRFSRFQVDIEVTFGGQAGGMRTLSKLFALTLRWTFRGRLGDMDVSSNELLRARKRESALSRTRSQSAICVCNAAAHLPLLRSTSNTEDESERPRVAL